MSNWSIVKNWKPCPICGRRMKDMAQHQRDHRSGKISPAGRRTDRTPEEATRWRMRNNKPTTIPARAARRTTARARAPVARATKTRKTLTHIDERGAARMVDVGAKAVTERRATARGMLLVSSETLALVRDGRTPKGDVLASARLAGIMAAKKTSELIPLAHPLPITHASLDLTIEATGIAIEATVATTAQTGVEMEALTAVAVAGLTLYDMLKATERGARLTDVRLVAKSGGRSGEYRAQ